MHGLVHFEVNVNKPEEAKSFLEGMFGWTLQPAMEGYWMCSLGDDQPGFGLGGCESMGGNESVCGYIEVDDINAATKKAESLGATIIQPVMELPEGHGNISVIMLPGSNQGLGLWSKG
ncbi:MAG: VOC family protein [bacterium]|nr:VOC family protein [bacterium]